MESDKVCTESEAILAGSLCKSEHFVFKHTDSARTLSESMQILGSAQKLDSAGVELRFQQKN